MIKLEETLNYKNIDVIERYNRDYPTNNLSAEIALQELIKYLWLCRKYYIDRKNNLSDSTLNFVCSMYPEMREIDDMWHTFLLFTQDYADFCLKYFGEFMHHTPKTETNKQQFQAENFEVEFTQYLSYVYDNLGEKTVCLWFKKHLEEPVIE